MKATGRTYLRQLQGESRVGYHSALRAWVDDGSSVARVLTAFDEGNGEMKTTGIRSEAGTSAWWRMQFGSCQAALAEVIAENTENVEALRDVVTDYGHHCDDLDGCDCSMARAARLTAHMPVAAGTPTHHTTEEDTP